MRVPLLYANANPVGATDPSGRITLSQLNTATVVAGVLYATATSQYTPILLGLQPAEFELGERDDIGGIITACAEEHFGPNDILVRSVLALAAFPIYKPLVGLPVLGRAARFTNVISLVGYYNFRGVRMSFKILQTRSPFYAAGRATTALARGFVAYDITSIGLCIGAHLTHGSR